MGRQHGQGAHSDIDNAQRSASVSSSFMPAAEGFGTGRRAFFRLEFRRSLRMHRRLALGFAFLGLVAALCVLRSPPDSGAKSVSRREPASTTMIESAGLVHWTGNAGPGRNERANEQKLRGMTYAAPRSARRGPQLTAVAATTTSNPGNSTLIRDVLVLLFGFVVLGVGAAVGFVLNRVKMAKADAAILRSEEEIKRIGQRDSRLADQQALDTLRFAVELGRASLEPEGALTGSGAGELRGEMGSFAAPAEQKVEMAAPASRKGREPGASSAAANTATPANDIPWWLAEAPPRSDTSLTQPRVPRVGSSHPEPSGVQGGGREEERIQRTPEEARPARVPRLTELRGTLFSTGIKELDHARHGGERADETKQTANEMAPLEAFLGAAESQRNATPPQTADAEPMGPILPAPRERVETGTRNVEERKTGMQSRLFLPRPTKPAKGKLRQDARAPIDKVEILPSRRGQYRRKD
jgi:hypothetical protein